MIQLLTKEQLAKRWKCSIRHIQRKMASGELRCVKDGKIVRFREADIAQYEENHCSEKCRESMPDTPRQCTPDIDRPC